MGIVHLYEVAGEAGGIWFAASYPLGATRHYRTQLARESAVSAYVDAIRATGGNVWVLEAVQS